MNRNKLIILVSFVLISLCGYFNDSASGQCCDTYFKSPGYFLNYPSYTYTNGYVIEPTLHIYIKNIVGGREIDRFYVNAFLRKQKYKVQIPVINGFLPDVTVYDNGNYIYALVLDYKSKTEFNHKTYFDESGYVNYSSPKSQQVKDSGAIKAVKTPDSATKTELNNVPSAVKPDSDLIFPNKTKSDNLPKTQEEKIINPGAIRLPSDKEIEDLLK